MIAEARERLELPDPAGRLWTYIRDELRHEIRTRIPDLPGWALTGGTVLAAQWKHRRSTDLDLKVPPRSGLIRLDPRYDPTFDAAMTRLGAGTPIHAMQQVIIPCFDGKIDILEAVSTPRSGQRVLEIDGQPETVLSNAQILSGKLVGRGLESPTRDLFDVAVAADLDPEALETAVNVIPEDTWRETQARWRETGPYHADQAEFVLKDVAERWTSIAEDPAGVAADRCEHARYERILIEWLDDKLQVTTRCSGERSRIRFVDSSNQTATADDLERQGITGYLDQTTRDSEAVLARIEAARRATGKRIVHATLIPPSPVLFGNEPIDLSGDDPGSASGALPARKPRARSH